MKQGMAEDTDLGEAADRTGKESRHLPDQEEIARLFPQFEILECLGRGGMGVVYKARQKSLDRLVALKILAPERENDPEFASRFAHEAKVLAQLNHPNIVTIHEFGESQGTYFFAMEFVDGVNLRRLIADRRLAPEEAMAIVPAICDALQYAHDRGVVHRDIKPENLLLDRIGRIKIADFGIAKILSGGAGDGEQFDGEKKLAGTPKYMAPEQMSSAGSIDHRADIYSLGVVFYEMLTGEIPQDELKSASLGKDLQIDVRLDKIVLRALEREPERRYQQASEIRTALQTIPPESPSASLQPKRFSWRWAATALGLILVVLTVAAGYIVIVLTPGSPPGPDELNGLLRVDGGTLEMSMGRVTVETFYIGRYEVTWEEWTEVREWGSDNGYDLAEVGRGCAGDHPVHSVSWFDAIKWCNAKSEMNDLRPVYHYEGEVFRAGDLDGNEAGSVTWNNRANGYRLPTEVEWEFAARGGRESSRHTYSGSDDLRSVGWHRGNSAQAQCELWARRGTWPAGSLRPNELGLYDMSGNVEEWVWEGEGPFRVSCGGHWASYPGSATVSARLNRAANDRNHTQGFRLARR